MTPRAASSIEEHVTDDRSRRSAKGARARRIACLFAMGAAGVLSLAVRPAQAQEPLVLRLTLVHFAGGLWQPAEIEAAAARAADLLAQCGIAPVVRELKRVDVDARFRIFRTPVSRELASMLRLKPPVAYFADDTHQNPAFDAEAVGRQADPRADRDPRHRGPVVGVADLGEGPGGLVVVVEVLLQVRRHA